ncbi:MAG: type II secretion system F family protein [Phycisphaerae bacterium]
MDMLSIGVLVVVALGLIVYSVFPRRGAGRDAVKRRLEGRRNVDEAEEIKRQARASATETLVKRATPVLSKLVMPMSDESQSQLRGKLTQAGYRARHAQTVFLASKTALLVLGGVGGAAVGASLGYDLKGTLACVMFAGFAGFLLPGLWLGAAVKARQDRFRRGLPDVLDLLVVSVESGLALDSALKRVGEEMARVHPEVSEEFRIATMETQMGIPRGEALDNMALRVGLDELRSLVSVIAQAERFGTSVAKALRNQANVMRTKRHQQAEERAQKTAVKLMIPLVLFIFPAMGVVLAGPAALRLMEAFAK